MQVGKISSFMAVNPQYQAVAPVQINKTPQFKDADRFEKSAANEVSFQGRGGETKVTTEKFGKINEAGKVATLFTITNQNGASVSVSNFGATVTSIKVPDKDGKIIDVAQGYNSVEPYLEGKTGHPGGTIGPVASKTMDGKFSIDGKEYQLECNKDNGKTSSHGGSNGLDLKPWRAKILKDGVKFTYSKKDGEGGHPGKMEITTTYRLDKDNNLHIEYGATTDKDTILNLTNHSYFNLDGAKNTGENAVLGHIVQFPNTTRYTPANELGIPTGEIAPVAKTPLDFRKPKKVSDAIDSDPEQSKLVSGGFDHNLCINGYNGKTLVEAAKIKSPKTGITLTVKTNLPGFQFYTANNLKPEPAGKDGSSYQKKSALCIEPQFYPNAINTKGFEKPILRKNEIFDRKIVYSFSAQ